MSGWMELVACIALPYFIPKIYRFITNRNQKLSTRRPKPYTLSDQCSSIWLLLLSGLFILIAFYGRQTDLLTVLRIHDKSAPHEMRNQFRSYMASTYPPWPETSSLPDSTKATVKAIHELYDDLRSSDAKRLYYTKYGPSVARTCTWCRDGEDYLFGASSAIMAQYATFFFLFGCGTIVWRKHSSRTVAATAIGCMACFDIYVLYLSSDLVFPRQDTFIPILSDSQFNQMHALRYVIFAGLALTAGLMNASDEWTDREILIELVQKTSFNYARGDATAMAMHTALSDDELRKLFVQYFAFQAKTDHLGTHAPVSRKDAQFKKDTLKGFGVSRVIHERDTIRSFMQLAVNESFLSSIDLLPEVDNAALNKSGQAPTIPFDSPSPNTSHQVEEIVKPFVAAENPDEKKRK
ncbi:hypothetical protein O5D80_006200 [Batrachochytrium dendrobatidis]|nr:hypothetical protein O5D80_006200 [Batrachochytrium dendrobatidis]